MKRIVLKCYLAYKNQIKLKKWKNKNWHNHAEYGMVRFIDSVHIGRGTYGTISGDFTREGANLSIGHYCSIAPNVRFIVCSDHPVNTLSTYPYRAMYLNEDVDAISKGDIIVDDDVWIGYGAIILSGVHIGQGAVIAAGAVVTSDVPSYAIVGGVPAKVIRHRFSKSVINYLLTLDYSRLNEEIIKMHVNELYTTIDDKSLDEIKSLYHWFPKKKTE